MSELLGADTDVLDRNADSLSTDARRVQDIRTLAQRAVSELQGCWQGSDLIHLLQLWEQRTSPLLAATAAALDSCAAQLRAQSTAQRVASQGGGYDGVTSGLPLLPLPNTSPAPPPRAGSPTDSATWWRSLSPAQQQQVIRLHPDWIGNRDGVSFAARDQANRSLIPVLRGRLGAEERRLEASLLRAWSGVASSELQAFPSLTGSAVPLVRVSALHQVRDKLASLDTITATLALSGERQLLLLDVRPERAEAAIANGNVDTADNVAVFVPGLTTTIPGKMKEYDYGMSQIQKGAERESKNARAYQSAATVTWIGYQAPQMGSDLVGANSVAGYDAAKNGAAKLVPFLQGISASRDRDAHLTLLGHSYGSTTAGLALRQTTGVDDAVFFGSPGLATDHASALKLSAGNADAATANAASANAGRLAYIEAQFDPVGDLGRFGTDPSLIGGIHHLSALESTVTDPLTGKVRHFEGVTGHGNYLDDHSTSQYSISVAVAGLPDRAVHSDGLGVGDALRLGAEYGPSGLSAAARLAATLARR